MASADVESPAFPALFQGISSDLKNSQQTWDSIVKTANKMAVQLLATAVTINNFLEQIQIIGDTANNVKGASRDIGASLTRFCMRHKAMENHMRTLSNSITNQFCESMEKKSDEWKKRVTEIERRRSKCFKKNKSKKYFSPNELVAEQKEGCLDLLLEQRNQYSFFVNALLPVLDIEINLLSEGEHVKQIRDNLDQIVNGTDAQQVVFNSMEDFCLNTERRMISPAHSIMSSTNSGGLDRTMSPSVDSFYSISRNSTVSSSYGNQQRPALPNTFVYSSPVHSRPPLPRNISYQGENTPREPTQFEEIPTEDNSMNTIGRRSRPLSFSGDSGMYNDSTLKPMTTSDNNRSSSSLIAETLQQIDQLGIELDSYCMSLQQQPTQGTTVPTDNSSGVGSSIMSSSELQNVSPQSNSSTPLPNPPQLIRHQQPPPPPPVAGGTVKGKKPPPPERRNSTIQTATSSAPSIADLRNSNNEYSQLPLKGNNQPLNNIKRPPPPPFPGNLFNNQRK